MSRVEPELRFAVELVIASLAAAPGTIVKVVVSSVRLPLWAVIVTVPARIPVTVFVAIPLEAVAEPVPLIVPVPLVCVMLMLVELSLVTTLPAASST